MSVLTPPLLLPDPEVWTLTFLSLLSRHNHKLLSSDDDDDDDDVMWERKSRQIPAHTSFSRRMETIHT